MIPTLSVYPSCTQVTFFDTSAFCANGLDKGFPRTTFVPKNESAAASTMLKRRKPFDTNGFRVPKKRH